MPNDEHNTVDLDAQAVELLLECRRSSSDLHHEILDFESRSLDHAKALEQAERFIALSQHLRSTKRTRWSTLVHTLELWWARSSGSLYAPAALATIIVMGTAGFFLAGSSRPIVATDAAPPAPIIQEFKTQWRERRDIELPDGSMIWLDWKTSIRTKFEEDNRTVILDRGNAAFKVISNSDRPFFVIAGDVETRVTGTEFLVSLREDSRTEVAVLEGQVMVSAGTEAAKPLNQEQLVEIEDGRIGEIQNRSRAELGQWREGMLVFSERPLLEALKTIQPYTGYVLDLREIADHEGKVSGVFFTDQANEALLAILQTHRIEYEQKETNRLRLRQTRISRPQFN